MKERKRNFLCRFDITSIIEERIVYLEEQKQTIMRELASMPEGNILVLPGTEPTNFRYYNRISPQDKLGVYLNKEQLPLKKRLSQKKYYEKLIKAIDIELCKLKKVSKLLTLDSIVDTYSALNNGIKKLITPINVDDETFAAMWKSVKYTGLVFDQNDTTEYYSDLGERMRSKSELLIANMLAKNNIIYRYEYPVTMKSGETLYPDFAALQLRRRRTVYLEHLGKMDDIDYVTRNLRKLDIYRKNGIILGDNLLITYETSSQPLRTSDIQHVVDMLK